MNCQSRVGSLTGSLICFWTVGPGQNQFFDWSFVRETASYESGYSTPGPLPAGSFFGGTPTKTGLCIYWMYAWMNLKWMQSNDPMQPACRVSWIWSWITHKSVDKLAIILGYFLDAANSPTTQGFKRHLSIYRLSLCSFVSCPPVLTYSLTYLVFYNHWVYLNCPLCSFISSPPVLSVL
jgi:hypothetical protein